ncbi:hypothetical protein GCM10020258_51990 [Sphingomonas yabuuchiae]
MLQLLFHSNRLLDHIVDRRPHFGVALARLDVYGSTEFVGRYLTRLIATPASALYQELAGNEISSPIGYQLPERNRLLHFLFADPRTRSACPSGSPSETIQSGSSPATNARTIGAT